MKLCAKCNSKRISVGETCAQAGLAPCRWKPLPPFTGKQLEIATDAAEAGRLNAEYRRRVAATGADDATP